MSSLKQFLKRLWKSYRTLCQDLGYDKNPGCQRCMPPLPDTNNNKDAENNVSSQPTSHPEK